MACFTCQVKTARKRSLKNYVIPEKAGIHCVPDQQSAPAFAGATVYLVFIPLSGPQAHARSEESADLVQFEVCGFYGSDHGESRRPAQGAGLGYPYLLCEWIRASGFWPGRGDWAVTSPHAAGGAYVPTMVVGMYAPHLRRRGADMPKSR